MMPYLFQINLGVMNKNENVKEELVDCLKNYNKLTVDDESNIDHKLCHGKKLKFVCNSVR